MSKVKKEPGTECNSSSILRRTIVNSSCNRSDDHDQCSGTSQSRSSDSSPERKQAKYGRPVARGSEMGIKFDKKELKKISVTVKNKFAPAPILHIKNPETVTPYRRRESIDHEDYDSSEDYRRTKWKKDFEKQRIQLTEHEGFNQYEALRRAKWKKHVNQRLYEGKRPIFDKMEAKEKLPSPDDHKSSHTIKHLESSRRRHHSRSKEESPDYRCRRSRSKQSGSRKHRRAHTPSSSCDSSSSSDERRLRRKYKERDERYRREYEREKELHYRERRLQYRRYSDEAPSHSNGSGSQKQLKERSEVISEVKTYGEMNRMPVVRNMHPGQLPHPPPRMLRPMRPFVLAPYPMPSFVPHRLYFHPPLTARLGFRPPRPPPRGYFPPP